MSAKVDRETWIGLLERVAAALPPAGPPVRLCLVGSAACLRVRGDERDVEDVLFLAGKHGVSAQAVRECAEVMPEPARQQVLENLVYLEIIKP